MARGAGTVTFKFLGDTSHLEGALDKTGGALKRVGGGFASMGKAAAIGIGAAAAVAIPFGIKAVQMASDVEESLSKVNTVFGKSGSEIDKWAKGAATSIGLSRGEALDAAGSFGNMFTQLGIGAPKAAAMSKSIVGLAADFASFHNADISEVINAQEAAFRGEYDSLQRFLPLINAATVEQKAMEMTGKASAKALTAQEKALAVNALMAEGAGKALGDFQRTSGGLANQMRILKAKAADFTAHVGSVLLPLVLKGLEVFGELSAELKDRLAPVMGDLAELVRSFAPVWTEITGGIQAFGAAFKAADGDVTSAGFPGFMEKVANFITGEFVPTVQKIGVVAQEVFANITAWADDHRKKFEGILNQVTGVFSSAFGAVKAVVVTAVDFLRGVWRVFGDDLVSFIREAFESILEVVRGALEILGGIFDLIKAVLTGKWGDAWKALKAIMDGVWDTIFALVRSAVTNVIPTILAGLGQIVTSIARTSFNGLTAAFKGAINWIIDRWNGLEFKAPHIPGFPDVTIGAPDIPRLARGGMFSGAAIVGEKGPELVYGAGRVVPNNQLGGITINVTGALDPAAVARQIDEILTKYRRNGGTLGFA